MINSIEFYCGMSREMKALKCSEMCVKTDDMIELIARLRQAEKDAARYRWLRDLPDGSAHEEIGNYPGDMWDDAIDEAMQCSK